MSCAVFRRRWEPGVSEDHAAACPACAEWLAGQRRAVSALAHLGAGLDAAVRPAQRERELRSAFRRARRPSASPQWYDWRLAVASAACLIAGAVGFALRAPAPTARATARSTTGSSAPAPAHVKAATPLPGPAPQTGTAARAGEARRHQPRRAPAPPASTTVQEAPATAFLPPASESTPLVPAQLAESPLLGPNADDPNGFYPLQPDAPRATLDSGQIVRVQLRPDVLESAGLPRRAVPAQGPVEAEVLVGPDGVARGIRLAKPAATVGRER